MGSQFCVLHTPLPEDAESEDYLQLRDLKAAKAREKVDAGNFNFEGAILESFKIPIHTEGDCNFTKAQIFGNAFFNEAKIGGNAFFNEVKIGGDVVFDGARIGEDAFFNGVKISGDVVFNGARIGGYAFFEGTKIGRNVLFEGAEIGRNALFKETEIGGTAMFGWAKIGGDALFFEAEISGLVIFDGAQIGGNAEFNEAKISEDTWFYEAKIGKDTSFRGGEIGGDAVFMKVAIGKDVVFREVKVSGDVFFEGAKIGGDAWFERAEIGGDALFEKSSFSGKMRIIPNHIKGLINYKETTFLLPEAQENACRAAKNQCITFGDNHEADDYFYREMEGKRRQKKEEVVRWGELFLVQWIFGYGVKPLKTFFIWLGVIFLFAFIYSINEVLDSGSSFIEYLYFSTTTAMTPGFGGYKILPEWQWLALIEAFFGTFMWAAFITIFARKYMR